MINLETGSTTKMG